MGLDLNILILGASGTGTTTVGRALAIKCGLKHIETDDLFWIPSEIPFTKFRSNEELKMLVQQRLVNRKGWVLSGSPCGWGDAIIPVLDLVVFLTAPAFVRVERIKKREALRFGKRILPGGDMHKQHEEFIGWTKNYETGGINGRTKIMHEAWLKPVTAPCLRIDGSLPLEQILNTIADHPAFPSKQ